MQIRTLKYSTHIFLILKLRTCTWVPQLLFKRTELHWKHNFPGFFFWRLRFIEHDENQSDKTKLIVKKNYNFSTFAYKYEREMTSCVKPCDISSEQWGRGCTPPPRPVKVPYINLEPTLGPFRTTPPPGNSLIHAC